MDLLREMDGVLMPTEGLVCYLHDQSVARFGGADGLRDRNALLGALSRGDAALFYEQADPITAAVRVADGIIRNHPFLDGNKRTGFAVLATMLPLNGCALRADPDVVADRVLDLAARRMPLDDFDGWLHDHVELDRTYALIEEKSNLERIPDAEGFSP